MSIEGGAQDKGSSWGSHGSHEWSLARHSACDRREVVIGLARTSVQVRQRNPWGDQENLHIQQSHLPSWGSYWQEPNPSRAKREIKRGFPAMKHKGQGYLCCSLEPRPDTTVEQKASAWTALPEFFQGKAWKEEEVWVLAALLLCVCMYVFPNMRGRQARIKIDTASRQGHCLEGVSNCFLDWRSPRGTGMTTQPLTPGDPWKDFDSDPQRTPSLKPLYNRQVGEQAGVWGSNSRYLRFLVLGA